MLRVYRIVNDPKRSEGSLKAGYKLTGAFVALALFGAIAAATFFLSSEEPSASGTFAGANGEEGADPASGAREAAEDAGTNVTDEPDSPLP